MHSNVRQEYFTPTLRGQPEYYEFLREKFCPRLAKMKIRGQFADKIEK